MKLRTSRMLFVIALVAVSTACAHVQRNDDLRLPIVELPIHLAATNGATVGDDFAIIVTGDGGWRPVDQKIGERLHQAGIPVVGLLSPDYFSRRRTPEESALDLERILRTYSARWNRKDIIVIGYSRGADALPFMLSRLPADLSDRIRIIALLGIEGSIDFKYHPSWIPFYHPKEPQFAVQPEVEKLRGRKILCIHGAKEATSLCPLLDRTLATEIVEPGGHHFAGHYEEIADRILAAARP